MIITWYGHACFKIQTKPQRGSEEVTIFTDPFDKKVGLRPPQGNADVVTISHDHYDHNNSSTLKGDPLIINSPGEYSKKNIQIIGIDSFHDDKQGAERGRNSIFIFESEELKLCHLGDLGHILSENQLDQIGEIDILMIPVGGNYTLEAKDAETVIGQLEPKIIIPMHYKTKGSKIDINDESAFCKEIGGCPNEKVDKLNIKKKDLDKIENKIILMDIFNS